jgi:hypothetical protein
MTDVNILDLISALAQRGDITALQAVMQSTLKVGGLNPSGSLQSAKVGPGGGFAVESTDRFQIAAQNVTFNNAATGAQSGISTYGYPIQRNTSSWLAIELNNPSGLSKIKLDVGALDVLNSLTVWAWGNPCEISPGQCHTFIRPYYGGNGLVQRMTVLNGGGDTFTVGMKIYAI